MTAAGAEIVYDPVDGSPIVLGQEYASYEDTIYFSSLQTQQMFFTLLDKGFAIYYDDSNRAKLVNLEPVIFWKLWDKSG